MGRVSIDTRHSISTEIKINGIAGVLKGAHSNWAYEHLESASDGVIDFELDATKDPRSISFASGASKTPRMMGAGTPSE